MDSRYHGLIPLLPRSLKRLMKRLRLPVLQAELLQEFLEAEDDNMEVRPERLHERLRRSGAEMAAVEDESYPHGLAGWQRYPMYAVRHALEAMGRDKPFVRHVEQRVNDIRHREHLKRHYIAGGRDLPLVDERVSPPKSGIWWARASMGLGCSTHLEAMTEEVAVMIVQIMKAAALGSEVLVVGAASSTLAAATAAITADGELPLTFDEIDVVGTDMLLEGDEFPFEATRSRTHWFSTNEKYPYVVVHLPAPAGPGGGRHREHYKGSRHAQRHADLGRLSHRRWSQVSPVVVVEAFKRLKPNGLLFLYVPQGIRLRRDYIQWPSAWVDLVDRLPAQILYDNEIREVDPPAQPFVGINRCPWRLIVLRRAES